MALTTPERELEEALIGKLRDLKYEYRPDIRNRASLEANFRERFEALNRVSLTEGEFQRLLSEIVTPNGYKAACTLRNREAFTRDDGTPLNYTLVNIKDWCKNTFEVVNQFRVNTDYSHHRYDVILLINGVPVVQIELKSLGINPRRAMEQIVNYKNDPGNGYTKTLLCFIQLFIVSNRDQTQYFTNNNAQHFNFDANEQFLPIYQFATEGNTKVTHLLGDFADHFLAKCTLGDMISKYVVLVASEHKLLMMRPYQIYAVKAIVDCIDQNCGNGYIWHTTGSGKTLTSFKAATLLKTNENIHKCLFVVDRKDLDRQTRDEFNRFQANCVEENTNTATLVRRLLSDDYADKIIVTTIQKLGLALDENRRQGAAGGNSTFKQKLAPLRDKRMVFIFDECHRSQFGENHQAIKSFFPNSQLFGFTGTPIFEDNATAREIERDIATLRTTKDLFEKELHAYTITNAIEDRNVLRFHVDYYKPKDAPALKPGETFTKQAVAQAILDKHDAATGERRFNALLATASINDAIEYYEVFKKLQDEREASESAFVPLKVAAVFSPPAEGNKDVRQIQEDLPQEKEDNRKDPEGKKSALKKIIADYNRRYGTNHDLYNFDLYYQDVQKRIKDQEFPNRDLPKKGTEKIDVTIVVDMLLTGFDAKYLNTLYVDKNLKHHGLIQAFSRTNRVLNSTKPYGHILDFRQQQHGVDTAIALFSGAQADRAKEIWLVEKSPVVIGKFNEAVANLRKFMKSQDLECKPDQVNNLKGDAARIGFIQAFKEVQQLKTQLDQYTDLTGEQQEKIEQTLPTNDLRAFRGAYLQTAERLRDQTRKRREDGGRIDEDGIGQLDFEFVLFASAVIDYDYIMALIAKYSKQDPKKVEISREQLIGLIESDAKFLGVRDEIVEYVRSLGQGKGLDEDEVRAGYDQFRRERQVKEIEDLARQNGLAKEPLMSFVDTILERMVFDGEQLTDLMAPLDLGWRERRGRELALMNDLVPLLKKRAQGREISGLKAYATQVGENR
ncbi:MAG: type I restriction endonuclease subunit R [Gammaproteobacteria bacterium]|nr:type I restriction endonuclease subunit R [Gammaproteobacteria bacterium]MCY4199505.1 type I restriction endonuclease subunit R [Gammaproteobacteria bacterium]MCY4277462.1 type I restriction endonuclease subunit R [Gammaproteobacteria bacterium]